MPEPAKYRVLMGGTFLAVSAQLLTVNHTGRAMAFFNPATMPVRHSVRNPCDCLPNFGLKNPRAVLLRDDTDVSASRRVVVLIAPLRFSAVKRPFWRDSSTFVYIYYIC